MTSRSLPRRQLWAGPSTSYFGAWKILTLTKWTLIGYVGTSCHLTSKDPKRLENVTGEVRYFIPVATYRLGRNELVRVRVR